ncbi:MAG: hypothetical protein JO304_07710 [Solirubrobacterales bacterium]|nr:hypothetical protein [Solirubrobacterales bacterium]
MHWGERDEPANHSIGFRRLSGWVSRSFDAAVADLKVVDCGSLDVLLYCPDEVAASAPGEGTLIAPADLA